MKKLLLTISVLAIVLVGCSSDVELMTGQEFFDTIETQMNTVVESTTELAETAVDFVEPEALIAEVETILVKSEEMLLTIVELAVDDIAVPFYNIVVESLEIAIESAELVIEAFTEGTIATVEEIVDFQKELSLEGFIIDVTSIFTKAFDAGVEFIS